MIHHRPGLALHLCLALALIHIGGKGMAARINRDELRDKIYGCWMGKSIGGTLGTPFEGRREVLDVKGYTHPAGEPLPNDDLDLQLVWLKALQDRGPKAITNQLLGEYWLDFIPPYWNEYGICKSNMRAGLLPPMSGMYKNHWKDSNGAWIRTEIWACISPGFPDVAVKYAYADASVDHGSGEGTIAALFTAAIESAAFVTSDRDELLSVGLAHIPPDSRVARSVKIAMDCHANGMTWQQAREAVVKDSSDLGWFQAPANVAFYVIGWLYGEDDFGKSLCIAVNCGDDTDCTGATLGSIFGILKGRKAIPEEWVKPIGERIVTVAVNRGNFGPPGTVKDLTDQVMAIVPQSLAAFGVPVEITSGPTEIGDLKPLRLRNPDVAKDIWGRPAWSTTVDAIHSTVMLDYGKEPDLKPGEPFKVTVKIWDQFPDQRHCEIRWNLPPSCRVSPAPVAHVALNNHYAEKTFEITADQIDSGTIRGVVQVIPDARATVGLVPVIFFAGN